MYKSTVTLQMLILPAQSACSRVCLDECCIYIFLWLWLKSALKNVRRKPGNKAQVGLSSKTSCHGGLNFPFLYPCVLKFKTYTFSLEKLNSLVFSILLREGQFFLLSERSSKCFVVSRVSTVWLINVCYAVGLP